MKILAETHTHTNACAHAYNTITEMVSECKRQGTQLIAITDHAPYMPDSPHLWHFANLKAVPRKIDGIYVLRGVEANIIDMNGALDMPEAVLKQMDVVIASVHPVALSPGTLEDHTRAYMEVMRNPYVDILGHCGWPDYAFDIDRVLGAAKEYDKIVEINSHTFSVRKKNIENCKRIARRCMELGVKIVISSDAHSIYELGNFEDALAAVDEIGIDESLVMNTSAEKFLQYLCRRKGLDRNKFESTRPGV